MKRTRFTVVAICACMSVLAAMVLLAAFQRMVFSAFVKPPKPTKLADAAAQSSSIVRSARLMLPPSPPFDGTKPAIHLKTACIRPETSVAAALPSHRRPSSRGMPWMVMFSEPIQRNLRRQLDSIGASIRSYLPVNALLIEIPPDRIDALRHLPAYKWSGEYRPEYKVQPLLSAVAEQHPDLIVPITMQTFSADDIMFLRNALRNLGASDIQTATSARWGLARAALPASIAVRLALEPEVQWIECHVPATPANDIARSPAQLNVEEVHATLGLDGLGQIVAVADTGLDSGNLDTLHPDLAGRVLHVFDIGRLTNWSDTYFHGTHVAASLLGTGTSSSGRFRGMAPGAQLVFQSIMDAAGNLSLPANLSDLYMPPYSLGARIHSDSWGSAVAGEYNADSMTTDEAVWNQPDLFVAFAAGNEGADYDRDGVVDSGSLNAPASAKNVLAVGASESGRAPGTGGKTSVGYGYAWGYKFRVPPIATDLISSSPGSNPQGMAAFSSRGPTQDGRIKPDVVAPGTDIISARSRASADTGWGLVVDNMDYCFMGGTSMATPLVAGAAAIVRQYCVDRGIGNPSAALLKAAIVGSARSLSPGQYGTGNYREIPDAPRPNWVEGWGQVDVGGLLLPAEFNQSVFIEGPEPLFVGETNEWPFWVHRSAPITAVMAYSDYPSALSAGVNLVNDLDLVLVGPTGETWHPNGREVPDSLNNVEGIDFSSPATGKWTAVVSGRNIPEGPQPYALFLRGSVHMPINILHEPLENTISTNESYRVEAVLESSGTIEDNGVRLIWIASGSQAGFATAPMTTTNGSLYESSIPAHPMGTRIWYYIVAGPTEYPSYHPAEAPLQMHVFDVAPPVLLSISGHPTNHMESVPAYGQHLMASNRQIFAQALFPEMGLAGHRLACVGWIGSGSVPPYGAEASCSFVITNDSSLAWNWEPQLALVQRSEPEGAVATTTWHRADGWANSIVAPERFRPADIELVFSGWQVDGSRYPEGNHPSPLQIVDLSMTSPRSSIAMYLPENADEDANGLPDWFELRYWGQLGQNRFADPDNDGFENELEAADHSNPRDSISVPISPNVRLIPLPSSMDFPAPWLVCANASDNDMVESVFLHWQRNGGIWRTASMTNAQGSSTYCGTIPSPARDGDVVAYRVSARDMAGFYAETMAYTVCVSYARARFLDTTIEAHAPGNTTTNANLSVLNAGSQPLVVSMDSIAVGFFDDMENGTNGWSHPDGNVDWHLSAVDSHSPNTAWYCGRESTQKYLDSTHASLATPSIRLGAISPKVTFFHRARFEPDQSDATGVRYWDSGLVEISENGGTTWKSLLPEGGYPGLITSNPASPFAPDTPCFVDTVGWTFSSADLSEFAGREIQIRFRFGADQYVVSEGWRIDDVEVLPHSRFDGWLSFPATNAVIPPGLGTIFPLLLDSTPVPPMETAHLAVRIFHNDPEQPSPMVVPASLMNTTRRVRIAAIGPGTSNPSGELFVQEGQPFSMSLAAASGYFIADVSANGKTLPMDYLATTQSLEWTHLDANLDLRAVFSPMLEDNSVPVEWLALHGLTTRHWMAEASLDADLDGLLTWQEFAVGSNPTNPADAPLALRLLPPKSPDAAWRLAWHGFTNRSATYVVLSTPHLGDAFEESLVVPANPPVMTSPPLPPSGRYFGVIMR